MNKEELHCHIWVLMLCNTVQGHAGKFVFGQIGPKKTPVALLVGRAQSVMNITIIILTRLTRIVFMRVIQWMW
jgi:purine-nucleoside phosphorylase